MKCSPLLILASILILLTSNIHSQNVINAYAKVIAINGVPRLTITNNQNINNSDETNYSFQVGDKIIIMQMQDDVVGGNTGNNTNFGNLSNIQSAGLYEVRTISNIQRYGNGVLRRVFLDEPLNNSYNINANSSVQIISFQELGSPNYSTTANLTALDWNGDFGGILAINVAGNFTLNHNLIIDGTGFRGGDRADNNSGGCNTANYRNTPTNDYTHKGESIYKVTNNNYLAARGKIINGGGGANAHNGGGAGGGNYSAGGNGGAGWQCGGTGA